MLKTELVLLPTTGVNGRANIINGTVLLKNSLHYSPNVLSRVNKRRFCFASPILTSAFTIAIFHINITTNEYAVKLKYNFKIEKHRIDLIRRLTWCSQRVTWMSTSLELVFHTYCSCDCTRMSLMSAPSSSTLRWRFSRTSRWWMHSETIEDKLWSSDGKSADSTQRNVTSFEIDGLFDWIYCLHTSAG